MNAQRIRKTLVLRALVSILVALTLMGSWPTHGSMAASGTVKSREIYGDALVNGWQEYGWATINYANSHPVHTDTRSISVRATAWQALFIHHAAFSVGLAGTLSFWINGGASGGQHLQVLGLLATKALQPVRIAALPKNGWRHITLSLASLGVADNPKFDGFWIQDATGTTQPVFYVDDISLITTPPTTVNVTVDARRAQRKVDPLLFGVNTAAWSEHLSDPNSATMLSQMGNRVLRFPGGTLSDRYNWSTDKSVGSKQRWATDISDFAAVVEKTHSSAMITVNYGTGTPREAAALVAWANAAPTNTMPIGVDIKGTNWHTVGFWAALRAATPLRVDDGFNFLRVHHPAPYHLQYWEIGNEVYASWEADDHVRSHDPFTYAMLAVQYFKLMKRVDPAIKVGVVVADGEDSFATYYDHPAANQRTGTVHNGWTPVLLSSLKRLGLTPDFVAEHNYAQSPGAENDVTLLQYARTWPAIVAALRAQLTDYLGAAGARVEIDCTEDNSVTNNPGKQTTSLVNGLFLADSLGFAMQTELGALLWWDFRDDGRLTTNNNNVALYGRRRYGGYEVLASANDRYPTFYARKLLTHFASGGDYVLRASTTSRLLDAFAVRQSNGTLTLLLINKSSSTVFRGAIYIEGFSPFRSAATYSYGMAQDNAAQSGIGSPDIATGIVRISGPGFSIDIPPYTMDVLTLHAAK
jgi:alpha-N-arabinofuranosidase